MGAYSTIWTRLSFIEKQQSRNGVPFWQKEERSLGTVLSQGHTNIMCFAWQINDFGDFLNGELVILNPSPS